MNSKSLTSLNANGNKSNGQLNKTSDKAQSQLLSVASRFTQFKQSEVDLFIAEFKSFDKNGDGTIDVSELGKVCHSLGENMSIEELSRNMSHVDLNGDSTVDFEEFLKMIVKLREGRVGADRGFGSTYQKQARLITVKGANDNTTHSINEDEQEQFVIHINQSLRSDPDLKGVLPMDSKSHSVLYEACQDGLVLSKLINFSVPETIDERALNKGKLNMFQKTENNNVAINSAKAIGCSVVNIGSQDLIEGREHLVLGLVWQIIKIGLFAKVDLQFHPELFRLLEPGETLDDLLKLPVDQILLRWFNYHLKKAGWARRVTNFSSDIKDAENYAVLLNQLAPEKCSRDPLKEQDVFKRAEAVLANAEKLDCNKYVTAKSINNGNPKLNLAFVANLFNVCPGLEPLSETEKAALDEWLFASQGDREARAFALWLNSLNVDPFVNNLYEDLRNGVILLQAMDKIHPGSVNWKKVTTQLFMSRFKMLENTNYVTVLGKSFNYSLVGIQGADLTEGNRKLTLALVWQLMRDNVIQILKSLSKDGTEVTENDMVAWANSVPARAGKSGSMSSFRDPGLKTGIFFLDVINGIKKGIVNYDLVTDGADDEKAIKNAKYAISIARKLGATIFLMPDDITTVKPKMILTFIGALMAIDRQQNAA